MRMPLHLRSRFSMMIAILICHRTPVTAESPSPKPDVEIRQWINLLEATGSLPGAPNLSVHLDKDVLPKLKELLMKLASNAAGTQERSDLVSSAEDFARKSISEAVDRRFHRPSPLLAETLPMESPPEVEHELRVTIGERLSSAIREMGVPCSAAYDVVWINGVTVSVGNDAMRAGYGLITSTKIEKPFQGRVYGVRLGDVEQTVVARWGEPRFRQGRYRGWAIQKHNVNLIVQVHDGLVTTLETRFYDPRIAVAFDDETGWPTVILPPDLK